MAEREKIVFRSFLYTSLFDYEQGKFDFQMYKREGSARMSRNKKFFLWKVGITAISFFLVILIKSEIDWSNWFNNYIDWELCKDIIFELSAGVFSAMILVWFIDEINERIQDKDNKYEEIQKIQRADRILQKYIERYELFFYCVVTPIEQREFENIEMPSNFSFKDMKGLYQITTLISEGIFASSIECFSEAEAQLREEIKLTLRDIDFKYFPHIRELLLQFVEISLKYDQKNAWLDAKKAVAGGKTLADAASELLETDADEWYEQIKTGEEERPHSMIHPYIALYEMLNEERVVILKYKEQIKKIN